MPLPAVTLRRNGTTSSGLLGPPNEYSSSASYGRRSGVGPGSTALAGWRRARRARRARRPGPCRQRRPGENGACSRSWHPLLSPLVRKRAPPDVTLTGQSVTSSPREEARTLDSGRSSLRAAPRAPTPADEPPRADHVEVEPCRSRRSPSACRSPAPTAASTAEPSAGPGSPSWTPTRSGVAVRRLPPVRPEQALGVLGRHRPDARARPHRLLDRLRRGARGVGPGPGVGADVGRRRDRRAGARRRAPRHAGRGPGTRPGEEPRDRPRRGRRRHAPAGAHARRLVRRRRGAAARSRAARGGGPVERHAVPVHGQDVARPAHGTLWVDGRTVDARRVVVGRARPRPRALAVRRPLELGRGLGREPRPGRRDPGGRPLDGRHGIDRERGPRRRAPPPPPRRARVGLRPRRPGPAVARQRRRARRDVRALPHEGHAHAPRGRRRRPTSASGTGRARSPRRPRRARAARRPRRCGSTGSSAGPRRSTTAGDRPAPRPRLPVPAPA